MEKNSKAVCPELRAFSDCVDVAEAGHEQLHKHGRLSLFESRVLPSGRGRIAYVGGSVSALSFHPWAKGICAVAAHRSDQPTHRILKCYAGSGHIQLWRFAENDTRCLGVVEHNGECVWDLKWRPEQSQRDGSTGWEGTLAAALGDGTVLVSQIDSFTNVSRRVEKDAIKTLYPTSTLLRVNKSIASRSPVRVVEWSKEGNLLVVGAADGSIEVYDATSVDRTWPRWSIPGHESVVVDLRWLSETHLCSLGLSCVLRLRDIRDPVSTLEQNMEGLSGSMSMDAPEPNVAIIGGDYGYLRVVRLSGVDGMMPQRSVKRVRLQSGSFRDMCSVPISGQEADSCSQTLFYTGGADGMLHECKFPRPIWTSANECEIGKTQIGERLRWTQTTEIKEGGEEIRTLRLQLRNSLASGGQELSHGSLLNTENGGLGGTLVDTLPQETSTSSASRKPKRSRTVGREGLADAYSHFGAQYKELAGVTRTSLSAPSDILAVGISGGLVTWVPLSLDAHKRDARIRHTYQQTPTSSSATKPPRKRGRPRKIPTVLLQSAGMSSMNMPDTASASRMLGTAAAESESPMVRTLPEKTSPTSTTQIPTPPASYSTDAAVLVAGPPRNTSPLKSSSPKRRRSSPKTAQVATEPRRKRGRPKKGSDEADLKSSDSANKTHMGQSDSLSNEGVTMGEEIGTANDMGKNVHATDRGDDTEMDSKPEKVIQGSVRNAKDKPVTDKAVERQVKSKDGKTPGLGALSPAEVRRTSVSAKEHPQLKAQNGKEAADEDTEASHLNDESIQAQNASGKATMSKASTKRARTEANTLGVATRRSPRTRHQEISSTPARRGGSLDATPNTKPNPSEENATAPPRAADTRVAAGEMLGKNAREETEKAAIPKTTVANSNRARGRIKVAKIGENARSLSPPNRPALPLHAAAKTAPHAGDSAVDHDMQIAHSSPPPHATPWPDVGKMLPPPITGQTPVTQGSKLAMGAAGEQKQKRVGQENGAATNDAVAQKDDESSMPNATASPDGKLDPSETTQKGPPSLVPTGDRIPAATISKSTKEDAATEPARKRQRSDSVRVQDAHVQALQPGDYPGVSHPCRCRVRVRAQSAEQAVRLRVRAPSGDTPPRRSARTRTRRAAIDEDVGSPRGRRAPRKRSVKLMLRIAEPVALTDSEGEAEPVTRVPVRLRVREGGAVRGAMPREAGWGEPDVKESAARRKGERGPPVEGSDEEAAKSAAVGDGGRGVGRKGVLGEANGYGEEMGVEEVDGSSGSRTRRVRRPSWKLA